MGILTLGALCKNNYEYWLPSKEINALFYVNHIKGEVVYVGSFDNIIKEGSWKIARVLSWNNKIYCFSNCAYECWEVDPNTRQIKSIVYSDYSVEYITNIEIVGDEVWVFSANFDMPIICWDLRTRKWKELEWNCDKKIGGFSITRTVSVKNRIYFASRKEKNIYLFTIDCEKKQLSHVYLENITFINCLDVYKNDVWILAQDHKGKTVLCKYDMEKNNLIEQIELNYVEKMDNTIALKYFRMIVTDRYVFLFPALAKQILAYDLLNQKEILVDYPAGYNDLNLGNGQIAFFELQREDGLVYLFPHISEFILKLDLNTLLIEPIELFCNKANYEKAIEENFKKVNFFTEDINVNLETFLENVIKINMKTKDKKLSSGKQIFDMISHD